MPSSQGASAPFRRICVARHSLQDIFFSPSLEPPFGATPPIGAHARHKPASACKTGDGVDGAGQAGLGGFSILTGASFATSGLPHATRLRRPILSGRAWCRRRATYAFTGAMRRARRRPDGRRPPRYWRPCPAYFDMGVQAMIFRRCHFRCIYRRAGLQPVSKNIFFTCARRRYSFVPLKTAALGSLAITPII